MMTGHTRFSEADGIAALSAYAKSLILALTDLKVISEQDVRDSLTDVVTTNSEAASASQMPEKHQAVVAIVRRILAGKDGVRAH